MYLKLNRVPFNVIWYVSNEHVDWDLCQNKSSRWKIALLWIKLKWHFSPGQCFLISKFDATTFRKISIWKTRSKTLFYRSKKLPNSGFRCWNRYNDIKYMPQTYTCKVKPVWSHSCVIRFTVLTNTDFHTLLTVFYVVFFTLCNPTPFLSWNNMSLSGQVAFDKCHCVHIKLLIHYVQTETCRNITSNNPVCFSSKHCNVL